MTQQRVVVVPKPKSSGSREVPWKPLIYFGVIFTCGNLWVANSNISLPRGHVMYQPLQISRAVFRVKAGNRLTHGDCALIKSRGERSNECDLLLLREERRRNQQMRGDK